MHSALFALIGLLACRSTHSAPVSTAYYFNGGQAISATGAITFNDKPIGTTELPFMAVNGAIHALSDGHHFRQDGWYLSDVDGGAWQYLPELRANHTLTQTPTSVSKRDSITLNWKLNGGQQVETSGSAGQNKDEHFDASVQFDWQWIRAQGNQALDIGIILQDGSFDAFAGSNAMSGELRIPTAPFIFTDLSIFFD